MRWFLGGLESAFDGAEVTLASVLPVVIGSTTGTFVTR
jgi:hypothetical protein